MGLLPRGSRCSHPPAVALCRPLVVDEVMVAGRSLPAQVHTRFGLLHGPYLSLPGQVLGFGPLGQPLLVMLSGRQVLLAEGLVFQGESLLEAKFLLFLQALVVV